MFWGVLDKPAIQKTLKSVAINEVREIAAGLAVEPGEIDTLCQAEAHHQCFGGDVFRRQAIGCCCCMPGSFDLGQPRFGRACLGESAACPGLDQATMGAGANASPFPAAPVNQIVRAFMAGCGVIGDS